MSATSLIRYSRWALAITVGCMPLYVVRFRVGPFPTTVLEILVLLTIALYAAGRVRAGSWRASRTGLEIPLALLLIAGGIGILVSPDHIGALGLYRAYFIEPALLFYVAVDLLGSPNEARTVLLGFAVGATAFAIGNLGAWADNLAHHNVIGVRNAPEVLYTSPNSVAIFLEPPIAIAAGFALYASERRDRIVAVICLPILLASMVLTLSRAGLLTLAVMAIGAVITMPQLRLKVALLLGASVSGLAISRIPWVQERLSQQLDPNYSGNTFEGRVRIWSDTLVMLRDHPIFGAGVRNYAPIMRQYLAGRTPELYPHNIFLAMWVELGLLGLIAFVALMATLLWRGWQGFGRAIGFARPLLWGTSMSFVAIVVHGLVDTPYFNNDLALEFWALAALEIVALALLRGRATDEGHLQRS
ncbi:MAG TPA: O-antigen ligase family protein [Candidatus Dormibacteraeota bacterium]|nr:O-antigen ligase family protein [Candidatus Dormibacteraeota bacterium]